MKPDEMRQTYEFYRAFTKDRDGGSWESHPVMEWYGRKYVVTGTIKLATDLQRLEVVDITEYPNEVALFSNSWPDQGTRRYALVHHADEGHDSILLESGSSVWVNYADLPIRVTPGTKQDAQTVRQQQMDELEASVDAGGSIGL